LAGNYTPAIVARASIFGRIRRLFFSLMLEPLISGHFATYCSTALIMENIKDEFQGFGKGFVDFPRRLPEDCVEYTLYIINSKLQSQKELLTRLEAVRKEAVKLTNNLLKDYIWQRDSFSLELESGKGAVSLI
jgi:hypothetical protein